MSINEIKSISYNQRFRQPEKPTKNATKPNTVFPYTLFPVYRKPEKTGSETRKTQSVKSVSSFKSVFLTTGNEPIKHNL